MTFEDLRLKKPLLKALEQCGISTPTPIQTAAFSPILSGRDVVGTAQTGTGKTFAYLLPILHQLSFSDQLFPRVLIVVPTRELVVQVVEEIKLLTEKQSIRVLGVYGGTNINTQKDKVSYGLDIIVGTPGRLFDLTLTGVLRLRSIQKLVIDEVDELLSEGFRPQLVSVMELVAEKRQNIMFSATLYEEVQEVIQEYFNNPKMIEIVPLGTPLEQIEQRAYPVLNFNTKLNLLKELLKTADFGKVLIFVANKKRADLIFSHLSEFMSDLVGVIHSNKSQNYRLRSLANFKEGTFTTLVATDVMSRGLDIANIEVVISIDAPRTVEDYIHRIGRTGRVDEKGLAISFFAPYEEFMQHQIEEFMQYEIPMMAFPEEVKVSDQLIEEEKPASNQKDYLRDVKRTVKKESVKDATKALKNRQVNSGSPSKKRPKGKKVNRGHLKRKFKKNK